MAIVLVRKFYIGYADAELPVLAIRERRDGVDYLVRGVPAASSSIGEKIWVSDDDVTLVSLHPEDREEVER